MAKVRNAEYTRNRIAEVSLRLFLEKGYERTTIQDIIDALGDLSKGAIYHHFKSKEDILLATMDMLLGSKQMDIERVISQTDKTGLEILKEMLEWSLNDPNQTDFFELSPSLLNIPLALAESMRDAFFTVVPDYVLPVVERGVKDGSIRTEYPREVSELIVLFGNYWLNPLVFPMDSKELENKIKYTRLLFAGTGIDELMDDMLDGLEKYRQIVEKK